MRVGRGAGLVEEKYKTKTRIPHRDGDVSCRINVKILRQSRSPWALTLNKWSNHSSWQVPRK